MTNVDHKLSLGFYVSACFFKLQYEFSLFVMGKCVPRTSYINVTHKEAKGRKRGWKGEIGIPVVKKYAIFGLVYGRSLLRKIVFPREENLVSSLGSKIFVVLQFLMEL